MRHKWPWIILGGVTITVTIGLVLWFTNTRASVDPANGDPRSIGEGVTISGDQVPTDTQAAPSSNVTQPFQMVSTDGPMLHISPDGKLAGQVTITFKITQPLTADETLLLATSESPAGPWTLLKPDISADGSTANVRTDHFSFWQKLKTSISGIAKTFREEVLNGLTANLTAEAEKPQCANENQARQDGYQITSSAKDTLYWCFGVEDGKRVLKVVNRMRYPLTMNHPGLTVVSAGRIRLDLDQLARIGSGDKTVLFPFDTAVLAAEVPEGGSAGISTEYSGWAQSLYQLEVGVVTATNILNRFGAGEGVISNGAIKKSDFDRVAAKMDKLLSVRDCMNAVLDPNAGTILSGCFTPEQIMDAFGWKGLLLAPVMAVGDLAQFFRSEFNALGDQLNGRSEYQIKITRAARKQTPAPQQAVAPFVGDWFVHGGSLTIRQNMTGEEILSIGPCTDALTEMCNEIAHLTFAVGATGTVTAKIAKITYATWDGGKPPPGFTPPTPPYHQTGQTFILRKEKPDLLALTDTAGNRTPFCTPSGPSTVAGECGA